MDCDSVRAADVQQPRSQAARESSASRRRISAWAWPLGFGLLGWFAAEIASGTTNWSQWLSPENFIFSFSYYMVQLAVVGDLILRYRLDPRRIFVLGVLFGLAEEAFFIKNPLPLALLLAMGHAMVTVLFPYMILRLLTSSQPRPYLHRVGYGLAAVYLLFLYVVGFFLLPSGSLDALGAVVIWIVLLLLFIRSVRHEPRRFSLGQGVSWLEVLAVALISGAAVLATHGNYMGLVVITAWFLIRQSRFTPRSLTVVCLGYLLLQYALAPVRSDYPVAVLSQNYPPALVLAVVLAAWLLIWLRRYPHKEL